MRVLLVRTESTDQGTFGTLMVSSRGIVFQCFTGELPWRDNAGSISCIPIGTYNVTWGLSPRLKKYTYRIEGVPKRSGVLIHSANLMGDMDKGYMTQLKGCIALGERRGYIDKQKAILVSKPCVSRFESIMGPSPFKLEIVNA